MRTSNFFKIMGIALVGFLAHPLQVGAHLFDATIPGVKLTLKQCFEMAEKQNLSMQAGRKQVERAKAMEGTAWDVDKTELVFGQNPASSGDTDNALTLSQGIEFPTVYTARRRQLKAETQAERSRLGTTLQQTKLDVATAYYAMLYQMHKLDILQRQDSILDRYCAVAEKRYEAGEAKQLEMLTAERMRDENHLEMGRVKGEAENQQTILMELLNTQSPIMPAEPHLIALSDPVGGMFDYAQTADAQYQHDRLKALDEEVKCAKTGYAPSLSLSLRTQALISSWDPYHIDRQRFTEGNFFGFEIGVGVPLFHGATKAKVRAAKKDRELAEIEMQQERSQKERDYRLGYHRLQNAIRSMDYYNGENLAKARSIVSLSTLEYENGEISYVEYVNALEEAIDMLMKHADIINEYNEAVIALMGMSNRWQ